MFFNSIKEISRLRKEINMFLSKGMFLIQLKKQLGKPLALRVWKLRLNYPDITQVEKKCEMSTTASIIST